MSFNKTVNYVQNTPVSLGYANEVSGTTGNVTAKITWNAKGGRLNAETINGVSANLGGQSCTPGFANTWFAEGTEAEVNDLLNGLIWYPKAYEDANIEQDFLTADREISEYQGELLLQCDFSDSANLIAEGQTVLISKGTPYAIYVEYLVTRVDSDLERIYVVLKDGYANNEAYNGGSYKNNPVLYSSKLCNDSREPYGYIIDAAIINPHGDYNIYVEIRDDVDLHDSGITKVKGSLFVKEPYFTERPPASYSSNGLNTWTPIPLGTVAQDDEQFISVQLLIKRAFNDPAFDGDDLTNKPSYVEDSSYACFNEVRVNGRISTAYPDGVVRWVFFGTPADCSIALQQLEIYSPPSNAKSFFIETRIVNGRARIYNDRGYD